jgi:hypothetical protein
MAVRQDLPDESSDDVEWSMHDAASRINASFWARNGFGDRHDERAAARTVIRQEIAHMRRLKERYETAKARESTHAANIGGE